MNENPSEPPADEAWMRAAANFAACQRIDDFIDATVRPIIEAETEGLPRSRVIRLLLARVHCWVHLLGRLDDRADIQAVLAASRAVFELAVELTLLLHEERGSPIKLIAWEQSAKLRMAQRLIKLKGPSQQAAAAFVAQYSGSVRVLRAKHWGGRHPDRWTGRNLELDAAAAEGFERAGFLDYYHEQHSEVCWHVHPSGVRGLFDIDGEDSPRLAARGFYDVGHFSLVACKAALSLVRQFETAERPFIDLKRQITKDKCQPWSRYDPLP